MADENTLDNFKDLLAQLRRVVSWVPESLRPKVLEDLATLEARLFAQRPPRLIVLGRGGAGKSSLINAVAGYYAALTDPTRPVVAEGWYQIRTDTLSVEILDSTGLGQVAGAVEEVSHDREKTLIETVEHVNAELGERYPDVILFLVNLRSHWEQDLASIRRIQMLIQREHSYQAPILPIVPRADEIPPKGAPGANQQEDPRWLANVQTRCDAVAAAFDAAGVPHLPVVPVIAYQYWRAADPPAADPRTWDGRAYDLDESLFWNIDRLLLMIGSELPENAQVAWAQQERYLNIQKRFTTTWITLCSSIGAVVGAAPIPVADLWALGSLQVLMITGIAYIGGVRVTKKEIAEFLAAMGLSGAAGYGLKALARSLATRFPGVGTAIGAATASGGTFALGWAAEAYFVQKCSLEEARAVYSAGGGQDLDGDSPAGEGDDGDAGEGEGGTGDASAGGGVTIRGTPGGDPGSDAPPEDP